MHNIVPRGGIGSGIAELQRLEFAYRETGNEPEMDELALAELHASLAQDAKKCPSVSGVAWIAKTLEELAIEEDEILEVLAELLIERADELGPQDALDVVISYGNVYWPNGDDLLDALAGAVRRQLDDFTQAEVAKLSNALIRMGGTDDTKHVGLFFEMRQRVNLPHVDDFIKEAFDADVEVSKNPSEDTLLAWEATKNMPNKRLKAKVQKMLQYDFEHRLPRMLDRQRSQELLKDGWDAPAAADLGKMIGSLEGGGSKGKDDDPPEARFEDPAASTMPR